jgi:hypothetical protein
MALTVDVMSAEQTSQKHFWDFLRMTPIFCNFLCRARLFALTLIASEAYGLGRLRVTKDTV